MSSNRCFPLPWCRDSVCSALSCCGEVSLLKGSAMVFWSLLKTCMFCAGCAGCKAVVRDLRDLPDVLRQTCFGWLCECMRDKEGEYQAPVDRRSDPLLFRGRGLRSLSLSLEYDNNNTINNCERENSNNNNNNNIRNSDPDNFEGRKGSKNRERSSSSYATANDNDEYWFNDELLLGRRSVSEENGDGRYSLRPALQTPPSSTSNDDEREVDVHAVSGSQSETFDLPAVLGEAEPRDKSPELYGGRLAPRQDVKRLLEAAARWANDVNDSDIWGKRTTLMDRNINLEMYTTKKLIVPGETEVGRIPAYKIVQKFPTASVEDVVELIENPAEWHNGILRFAFPVEQFEDNTTLFYAITETKAGVGSRLAAQLQKRWINTGTGTWTRVGVAVDINKYYEPRRGIPVRPQILSQNEEMMKQVDREFRSYDSLVHLPFQEVYMSIKPLKDEGCELQYVMWSDNKLPRFLTALAGPLGAVEASLKDAQVQLWDILEEEEDE